MAKPVSAYVRAKQIAKGIYDSPCLSECSFKKENDPRDNAVCKVCGMTREERKTWKEADPVQKRQIILRSEQRYAALAGIAVPKIPSA